MTVDKIGQV